MAAAQLHCKQCKKKFKRTHNRQIHCSAKCRAVFKKTLEWDDKQRNYKYLLYYGISLQEYNKMFDEQNGCCFLCNKHQSELNQTLHVDHNHETGVVRSLLCQKCNMGLGLFNDDKILIKKVLEYVS